MRTKDIIIVYTTDGGRARLLHPAQARLFRALALVILAIQLCNVDGGRDGCEYGNDIGAAVAISEDCGMKNSHPHSHESRMNLLMVIHCDV